VPLLHQKGRILPDIKIDSWISQVLRSFPLRDANVAVEVRSAGPGDCAFHVAIRRSLSRRYCKGLQSDACHSWLGGFWTRRTSLYWL